MSPILKWAALLTVALGSIVLAHGPIHEQIDAVTKQIQADPTNAELYLKRGELRRVHEEWELALADYDSAAKLNATMDIVDLSRGKLFHAAGRYEKAKESLDRYLAKHPDHTDALAVHARVLVNLRQRLAAVEDFTKAISLLPHPEPDLFIERARALVAEGNGHVEEALRGLDEGIGKLGPLVTLELAAIDLELSLKRFDAAMARVDKIAAQSQRKESWLARRGEILEQAGRKDDARQAYTSALAAIQSLPEHLRTTKTSVELEARLRESLARIGTGRRLPRTPAAPPP